MARQVNQKAQPTPPPAPAPALAPGPGRTGRWRGRGVEAYRPWPSEVLGAGVVPGWGAGERGEPEPDGCTLGCRRLGPRLVGCGVVCSGRPRRGVAGAAGDDDSGG